MVHSIQHITAKLKEQPKDLINVDANNALNCTERQTILDRVVVRHGPELARFVYACHAEPAPLYYGQYTILRATGTQKSDPLSTLLFAIAIHPPILSLDRTIRPALISCHANDANNIVHRDKA